ncbi:MAG: response regulator, partial [Oligoflexales bacterium]|nr:response regulator [Oligoflexales bacterium]
NGIETIKKAKELDLIRNASIFMLTTEKAHNKLEIAKSLRITAWLVKPIYPEGFLSAVSSVLSLMNKKS